MAHTYLLDGLVCHGVSSLIRSFDRSFDRSINSVARICVQSFTPVTPGT